MNIAERSRGEECGVRGRDVIPEARGGVEGGFRGCCSAGVELESSVLASETWSSSFSMSLFEQGLLLDLVSFEFSTCTSACSMILLRFLVRRVEVAQPVGGA